MKAKDAIQLYWAIDNCIQDFLAENRSAEPKEYFLSIKKAGYGWQKTTGNPYDVKLLPKSEADISTMPCLAGLYGDYVDEEAGDVKSFARLDPVSKIIDDWFIYNK